MKREKKVRPKILLTGFKLFGKFQVNPSEIIVNNFVPNDHVQLKTMILEVDFAKALVPYTEMLSEFRPDFIINLGLSATSGVILLEHMAINKGFDHIHDRKHFTIQTDAAAPLALANQLDLTILSEQLCEKQIPVLRSNHAGSYLCNFIFYHSLQWSQQNGGDAIFVHIPFTTALASRICLGEHKAYPSLPQTKIEEAIHHIIDFYISNQQNDPIIA